MRKPKKPVRTYDGSRRRQRAEQTRERILEAARGRFAERGYAETTIEMIAAAADVALPTVYAVFRSKRGVLAALMQRLVSGEEGGPPLLETRGAQAVHAETDPRRTLERFVDHLIGVQERVIPTYEVMKSAARSEPEVAELLGRMQEYRFSNITSLAARLAELGALRKALSVDDASRTIWAIASPELRQMLHTFARWPPDRYRAWLLDTLVSALLEPMSTQSKRQRR